MYILKFSRTLAQPARPIMCHNFIQSKDQSWSIPVGCFRSNSSVTGISYWEALEE